MIKGSNKAWARKIFNLYESNLLKRNFNHFYFTGSLPELNTENSLVVTPNHFSWWDGFFIDYSARILFNRVFYIMMLEEQLRKYRFFSKVGAFSIEPDSNRGIIESLNHASEILNDASNLLVFYPQGKIEPYIKKPVTIKPGLNYLLKNKKNTDVLPAAFSIQYSNAKHPDVYFRFGKLIPAGEMNRDYGEFCDEFRLNIDQLNQSICSDETFTDLFEKGSK